MIPSVLPTYNRAPLTFVKGEGTWLIEADGRRFLDLGAGIAVNALGHAHPALVAALTEQAQRLWHISNLYQIPQQQALADKLVEQTFADTVFFTNSGTEACELAVKMARKYWYAQGPARAHRHPHLRGRLPRPLLGRHRRRRVREDDQGLRRRCCPASCTCPGAITTRCAPPPPATPSARS